MSYEALFFSKNYAQIRKNIIKAGKSSADNRVSIVFGELGRRFEPILPDYFKTNSY